MSLRQSKQTPDIKNEQSALNELLDDGRGDTILINQASPINIGGKAFLNHINTNSSLENTGDNYQSPSQPSRISSGELKSSKTTDKALVKELQKQIAELYLKIKRCSKDVSISESQYIKHLETPEDREERQMIWEMDPRIVL